jgi:MATE family multidrug resistance protein
MTDMDRATPRPEGGGAKRLDDGSVPSWRAELDSTVKLALPLAGSFIGSVAISTTDVVMMGWLGAEALAAGSLGYNLLFPLYLLGLGVILAVAPMTASALGAGDERAVRRTFRQGLWVGFILAIPFGVVLWQGRPILLAFGQEERLVLRTEEYLRVVLWGLAPIFWYTALRSFLTALSRVRPILVITLVAVGVNALGNYALMFGHFGFPRLELVGAAISTVIVDVFLFLGLLVYVLRRKDFARFGLFERFWRADWPRFLALIKLGIPIGMGIIAEAFFFSAAIFLMGWISTEAVAAATIVLQCMAVAFMAPLGIGHATMVRVGYHAGAGHPAAVKQAAQAGLSVAFACVVVTAGLFIGAGEFLVGLFLSPADRAGGVVVGMAVALMASAALFQVFDGLQLVAVSVLRGLHATRTAMWLAFISFWGVGFTAAYSLGFPLGFGRQGVWWGLGVGLACAAVLAILVAWRAMAGMAAGRRYR